MPYLYPFNVQSRLLSIMSLYKHASSKCIYEGHHQARSHDWFWGGARDHQNVDLFDPKSGLFEPQPLNYPTKTTFFGPLCCYNWTLLQIWGGTPQPHSPPPPPWLRAWTLAIKQSRFVSSSGTKLKIKWNVDQNKTKLIGISKKFMEMCTLQKARN